MAGVDTGEKYKIKFKSVKKKRAIRKADSDSDPEVHAEKEEDEEDANKEALEEVLEIQRLRKRAHGVNAATLASGKKVSKVDELVHNDPDPFKLKAGGLLSLDTAKLAAAAAEANPDEEEEDGSAVGTQFSRETQVRDEDEEMRKFIEKEMEKRRGNAKDGDGDKTVYVSPEDQALLSLPEHLRGSNSRKNEEMLSSQMLSGIPEVDLGIEEKIRNIEATEMAKKKTAEERNRQKAKPSQFVPTNLAVNFRQPNRFKADDVLVAAPEKQVDKVVVTQRTVVVGQLPQERVVGAGGSADNDPSRATDDLHVTKFKKHFQRK